ncbi:MAG: M20 family metallopeptidase [Caldilineae bacterium]|nr:M20 family metallopeptidase [Chloroflexota bacterium]MCB9176296.1 M20 family metallopeptidase [Caldilineae bacterium]
MIGAEVETGQAILAWLRARQEAFADLLLELASLESPSREPESQAPLLDLLAAHLTDLGYRSTREPGERSGGHLVARPAGAAESAPRQLLLGHCDTVWPRGSLREMPLRREGARLFGPGTYDMKAGLAQAILALRALRALGLEPTLAPVLLVNSDEEIGSRESTPAIRRLARGADRVLVLEPSLGPEGRLKTSRKGVGRFEFRVHGRAAHAGLNPEEGISAVRGLAEVVTDLFALNRPELGISVNVGQIDGGLGANVVAPEAGAVVDVRVPTLEAARQVEASLRAIAPRTAGLRIELSGGFGRPPLERDARVVALWDRARQLAGGIGIRLEEGSAGGGSDGNTTARLAPTLDGLGPVGAGAHARHEQVDLPRSLERAALLALLLLEPPRVLGLAEAM